MVLLSWLCCVSRDPMTPCVRVSWFTTWLVLYPRLLCSDVITYTYTAAVTRPHSSLFSDSDLSISSPLIHSTTQINNQSQSPHRSILTLSPQPERTFLCFAQISLVFPSLGCMVTSLSSTSCRFTEVLLKKHQQGRINPKRFLSSVYKNIKYLKDGKNGAINVQSDLNDDGLYQDGVISQYWLSYRPTLKKKKKTRRNVC